MSDEPRPRAGMTRTLSEVVAKNVRNWRAVRGLTQDELGARLAPLGYTWVQATVSAVERGIRAVSVDEAAALAAALGLSVPTLLDPAGPERANERWLDVGAGQLLPPGLARKFLSTPWLEEEDSRLVALHLQLKAPADGE